MGLAVVRAFGQWVLDYKADASGLDFPYDRPWLAWGDAERIPTRRVRLPFDRDLNRRVSAWAAMWGLFRFLERGGAG